MQEYEHNSVDPCRVTNAGYSSVEELQVLIIENYPMLFAIICKVLEDYGEGEADTVFQHFMEEASAKYYMYDSTKGSVLAWLGIIARNKAIDRLRHLENYSAKRFVEYNDQLRLSSELSTYSTEDDSSVIKKNKNRILHIEVNKLKPDDKKIITHVGMYGISLEDFAEKANHSYSATKSRYYRALSKLRKALLEYEEFSEYR